MAKSNRAAVSLHEQLADAIVSSALARLEDIGNALDPMDDTGDAGFQEFDQLVARHLEALPAGFRANVLTDEQEVELYERIQKLLGTDAKLVFRFNEWMEMKQNAYRDAAYQLGLSVGRRLAAISAPGK